MPALFYCSCVKLRLVPNLRNKLRSYKKNVPICFDIKNYKLLNFIETLKCIVSIRLL